MLIRFLALALAGLSFSPVGRADTIVTYNIAAAVARTPVGSSTVGGSVNGNIAVDFTNLYASVANLTFQSNTPTSTDLFGPPPSYFGPQVAAWVGTPTGVIYSGGSRPVPIPYINFRNGEGDYLTIGLLPYLCTTSNYCGIATDSTVTSYLGVLQTLPPPATNPSPFYIEEYFTSGTATVATTPEPSSFALLGTGLLGALGVARKRFA